jgi:multiple sugar transport system permease protein
MNKPADVIREEYFMKSTAAFFKRDVRHYFMLLPFFTFFFVFLLWPMIFGLGISLTRWDGVRNPQWYGIGNYVRVFTNRDTLTMYKNLLFFIIFTLFCGIGVSFLVSVVSQRIGKIALVIAGILYFFPMLMPPYLSTAIWRWMFTPDYGIINIFLKAIGLKSVAWVSQPGYAVAAVVIVDMWKASGINTLFFMTGIKNIPRELYEAADIDGAGFVKKTIKITIPSLEPIIFLAITNGIIGGLQIFDIPWIMSMSTFSNVGGKGNVMLYPIMKIFGLTFGNQRLGEASAHAVLLLVIILSITGIRFAARKRKDA